MQNQTDNDTLRIDIGQVLREKNPKLARFVPRFAVNYLRRIVHEKELNSFVENYAHLGSIEFIRHCLSDMHITYTAYGLEKLDPSGRFIFASNHPFGGLDGVMLAEKVSTHFGDVRVVVNDILMNLAPFRQIFIPINKHGRQSAEYAQLYKDAFDSDTPIITFPAGLVSRRTKGVVADSEWKHNFIKQAIQTKRDIVPVFFEGTLSNFFYRLTNFRKALGIKAAIEMAYLSDEMFKQSGHHFRMFFGEPIPWQSLEGAKPRQAALEIRNKAYALGKE